MSIVADELIRFSSVLQMAYNFLTGRDYLKKKKFREKKKLISVGLPFSDLVYGFQDLIPVLPIRMHEFEIHKYLTYLGSSSKIFGWDKVTNFLGFVKDLGIKDINKTVEDIIENVITTINSKYNDMYDLGVESGISTDFCYGVKSLYGMNISKGKNCEANLNYTIRCSTWNKYLESLEAIGNPTKQIWIEIPPRNIGNALELLIGNIIQGITELEEISNYNYSDSALRSHFQTSNQIRQSYKKIIYDISTSDFYPCNPATFCEILSLLNISFHDYNSNATRYRDSITLLLEEMRGRINKGIGVDVSKRPKILITPMFGGWEPKCHEIIYELGGRALYGDWDLLRFLDDIPISNRTDPVEAYAQFLMNANSHGIGADNNTLTDSYVNLAKNLKADGLVFVQVFGCHSVSNCYAMLREKIRQELEIPSIALNFNKMGENVEQVRTRLGAFMEMYK
ncbi:MAG: 2-hydroxyacyl-CoA dehydratase family protein [Promethearchaeota archaeon]|jgi:benzoyl-CoA reductase/2-hydroxyglutaryl-CoA dehydratase subunit BcrC/BadD/HgdB